VPFARGSARNSLVVRFDQEQGMRKHSRAASLASAGHARAFSLAHIAIQEALTNKRF
jgi:hypothetical protein